MKIFERISDLQNELFIIRKERKTVGLVPTMGALHEGHASLVQRSTKENDVTVVSIFLNPTQFNDKDDLKRYPRTMDDDYKLLKECKVDYVFAPSEKEIYPVPDTRRFEFPPQSTVMEGAKRPGHFNGVCQIVSRLFYIIKPDKAYFGEKDWQQIAVIKRLVPYIGSTTQIVECPIIRDADGLAKSSRNTLLSADERLITPKIYQVLSESLAYAQDHTVEEVRNYVESGINSEEMLNVEYFEIVDGNTLLPVDSWNDSPYIVGCITVYCGRTPIRLIDHIKYKG